MVGGGLADIWKTSERSVPMSVFTWAAVFGSVFKASHALCTECIC